MPNPAKLIKLLEGIGHIRTQDGIQPLRLFDWQKGYIKAVCEHDEVAVLKSRDIGSSTVAVCLYTLLALIYGGDFVIASYKKDSAKAQNQPYCSHLKTQARIHLHPVTRPHGGGVFHTEVQVSQNGPVFISLNGLVSLPRGGFGLRQPCPRATN